MHSITTYSYSHISQPGGVKYIKLYYEKQQLCLISIDLTRHHVYSLIFVATAQLLKYSCDQY